MKKLILTSNKYSFCIEGHQILLARHWKDENAQFTVIGFDRPKVELNGNVEFQCLGEGFNDRTPWRDALSPFIQSLEDDYFLLVFEDHLLVNDVNLQLMNEVQTIMETDPSVGKIRMAPAYRDLQNPAPIDLPDYNENFYRGPTTPHSYLPTSLRPAVWRKELFLRLLHHPTGIKTPHDFERFNDQEHIDTVVLLPKGESTIYPEIDAMRFGKPNPIVEQASDKIDMGYYWLSIDEHDAKIFAEMKKTWEALPQPEVKTIEHSSHQPPRKSRLRQTLSKWRKSALGRLGLTKKR